jgi:hypothetical protein
MDRGKPAPDNWIRQLHRESKMASITSGTFLLKTPPHETTPILQGTASSPLHIHKKKGKKIRKARGL